MKRLLLLLFAAVPLFADSVDLGMELIAPASARRSTSVTAILRVTSYGPHQNPAETVQINYSVRQLGNLVLTASGSGWDCKTGGGGDLASGICSRVGLTTGTYPDVTLSFPMPTAGSARINAGVRPTLSSDPGPNPHDVEWFIESIPPMTSFVAVTASSPTVYTGDVFSYTYVVTNEGPDSGGFVQLQASLCCYTAGQPEPTFLGVTGNGWTCEHQSPYVRCTRPSFPVGTLPPVTVTLQAPAVPGTYISGGVAFSDVSGHQNNNGHTTIEVVAKADLSLAIFGASAASPGANVQHSVEVANGGPGLAEGLTVTIDGTAIVDVDAAGWSCSGLTCTRAELAGAALPIVVTSQAPPAGSFSISASVSATTADLVTSNNSATATITVDASMSLTAISPDSGPTAGGTQVTFTGEGFEPGAIVVFDNAAVATTFVSSTTLVAKTNAHAPGTVDVAVVNPNGVIASLTEAFTFQPPGRSRRRSARH